MKKTLRDIVEYSKKRVSLEDITLETYITTDNLQQNKQGKVKADKLPPNGGNVTKFDAGNILIANIRPYLKKIWLADSSGGSSADVLTLVINESYDSSFIYYALFRDDFFLHMMNGAKGTKMPRGDKNQILDFPIPKFCKLEQTQIAKVLSDLDAKIELNNKINQQLEAMAKTLYDYWFVQFDFPDTNGNPYKSSGDTMVYDKKLKREIPDGWKVVPLNNLCDKIGDGLHGTPKYVEDSDYSFINGNNLKNGFIKIENETKRVSSEEYKKHFINLNSNTILLSINGTLGNLAVYSGEKVILGKSSAYLNCKNKNRAYCYYYLKQNHMKNVFWNLATGSTIKNLSLDSIKNLSILLPNNDLVNKFHYQTKATEAQLLNIYLENQQLTKLRDWLLPMLMNGQITVKESQEEIQMNMAAEPKAEYKI